MKVRIVSRSGYGARDGRRFEHESVADLDERLALKLIRYGIASPAEEQGIETAEKPRVTRTTAKRRTITRQAMYGEEA